jgi:DNA-binding NarL/FixJ family response regulator
MKILLAGDHPIVRLGLRIVIKAEEDMQIVGEADSPEEILRLTRELLPDLVILPLGLGGEYVGVEICREIKAMKKAPYVLICTAYNSQDDIFACFLAGADSYVHRSETPARLLQSMRDTYSGKRVWLLGTEVPKEELGGQRENLDSPSLTPREKEVLGFMLQSMTNPQIARALSCSLPTVKTHVSNILRKLNLKSRKDLLR